MMKTKFLLSLFTLGGLLFAGVGSWVSWTMWRELETAVETSGVVRSSEVREERRHGGGSSRTYFIPTVNYEYSLNGRTYYSDDLYPGIKFFRTSADRSEARARGIVKKHPEGSEIRLWALPHDPAKSFLIRQRRVDESAMMLIGGILAAAGTWMSLAVFISTPAVRLGAACILFIASQGLTWLFWRAYWTAPPDEVVGSLLLPKWLLVAYVLICWIGLISYAPERFEKVRQATFASLFFGTLIMSLSTFVFVPLMILVPDSEPLRAMPWVGVTAAAVGLLGWMSGIITIGKRDKRRSGK